MLNWSEEPVRTVKSVDKIPNKTGLSIQILGWAGGPSGGVHTASPPSLITLQKRDMGGIKNKANSVQFHLKLNVFTDFGQLNYLDFLTLLMM